VFTWGAQLEAGSLTDYQRITDVNTEIVERFPNATLYQDLAGTIPVTAPGDTVGLMLDKSQGLVLGPEKVVNGTFDSGTTGWSTVAANSISVVGGQMKAEVISGSDGAYFGQEVPVVAGKSYEVRLTTISDGTSKIARMFVGSFWSGTPITPNSFGSHKVIYTATTTGHVVFWPYAATVGLGTYILCDNISVKEIPGNHATQGTIASRPTYGVVPQGGRRNLLLWSEDYSNAVWIAGTGASKSASKITNTSTTNVFVYQQVSGLPLSRFTASVDFKKDTARYAQLTLGYSTGNLRYAVLLDLDTGLFVEDANTATALTEKSYSISSVVDGWYRISISGTGAAGVGFLVVSGTNSLPVTRNADLDFTNATNGVAVNVRKADLRPASDLGNYQRVTTIYDVTEAGVPSCSYLFFDGVDDFMVTPTITPGIDKAQVFAGVRKLSDAAIQILYETSTTTSANTLSSLPAYSGSGTVVGPYWAVWSSSASLATPATYPAPQTVVQTHVADISAPNSTLRINGIQAATSSASQGTGNYLAYPLYIGRRGGTIYPFNGNLFGLITRFGPNLASTTINATEYWLNEKTGAF
jgi:hypothetical protein